MNRGFRASLLEVRALASTHPRGAEILPTDVCHPISVSLPHCTRALAARPSSRLAPDSIESFVGSRRRSCWGGTARSIDKVFACRCRGDLRLLTSLLTIPLRALRPLSRTNTGLNRLDPLHERAVTLRPLLWPETPSVGVDSSAAPLRKEPLSLSGQTARLESRSREKVTPPRRPKVSFRRCGLALMISAREVLPRS